MLSIPRTISNKDPISYLKERSDNSALGETELRRRLRTHLIPYKELSVGYQGLSDEERQRRVNDDYAAFLNARARLLVKAAQAACEGRQIDLSDIFDYEEGPTSIS